MHQGGSLEEPPADENRFELVLKKQKGVAVGPFGVLQIPISFKAVSLEESNGEVQIVMESAPSSNLNQPGSGQLLWQYPLKVSLSTSLRLSRSASKFDGLHTVIGCVSYTHLLPYHATAVLMPFVDNVYASMLCCTVIVRRIVNWKQSGAVAVPSQGQSVLIEADWNATEA